MSFTPFANSTDALSIGTLSIENRDDAIVLSGSLELRRDKTSLELARALNQVIAATISRLEADPALPDHATPQFDDGIVVKKNPFD